VKFLPGWEPLVLVIKKVNVQGSFRARLKNWAKYLANPNLENTVAALQTDASLVHKIFFLALLSSFES